LYHGRAKRAMVEVEVEVEGGLLLHHLLSPDHNP
jgi:hypothetical protein